MNKFFLVFMSFSLLLFVESCSCGRNKSVYDEYNTEGERKCGILNAPCCFVKKCEEGLVCDEETDICLEEEVPDSSIPVAVEPDTDIVEEGPCSPNPCKDDEHSTKQCMETGEEEYICECLPNYTWNEWRKKCEPVTFTTSCKGLPENAEWNVVSSIHQEWDGSKWVPSDIGTYNTEASTTECRFECRENYEWTGDACEAKKRQVECTGLPDHASWNTVSEITQVWNGHSWIPDSTAIHSTTSSTTLCRFQCDDGYYYNLDRNECLDPCMCNIPNSTGVCSASSYYSYVCECMENYTWNDSAKTCDPNKRSVACTGLPQNAVWNRVSSITQIWNGVEWAPNAESDYSENETVTLCRYKCRENYEWDSSTKTCKNAERDAACTRLPEHAQWNTVDHIKQRWNGSYWTPSTTGTYSLAPSETSCVFKCIDEYHWEWFNEEYACIFNKQTNVPCEGPLPENTHWNTTDRIDQEWNGSFWTPGKVGQYNPVPSDKECRFDCNENYFWNGTFCESNPCDCSNAVTCESKKCMIPNATGNCISKAAGKYVCECESGYYWVEESGCVAGQPEASGNICTGQYTCFDDASEITCPASHEASFFGQDAQYGTCSQHSFSFKPDEPEYLERIVYDSNTGLEWQWLIPTDAYRTWKEADEYCRSLFYNGYTGWRLPTPQELLTIADLGKVPAIDNTYFGPLTWSMDYYGKISFWTSKKLKSDPEKALSIDFNSGMMQYDNSKTDHQKNQAVCVWGDELPIGTFSIETVGIGENTVEIVADSTTGLMWQKSYEKEKTWEEALSYCETLTDGGFTDWRLPNLNEIISLSNFDESEPATAFPGMPDNAYFWSSTTSVAGSSSAFALHSSYGTLVYAAKSSAAYNVRCVRNSK